jgi:double-stranded uracil-DNA glycosylase
MASTGNPTVELAGPAQRLPLVLGDLHHAMAVGASLDARVLGLADSARVADIVRGAGFADVAVHARDDDATTLHVSAVRARSLADTVGPSMRMLVCGLNPSLYAADAGVGYARPGNRFWPAMLAAGLAPVDRDTRALLVDRRIGMTDLVKRATVAASEVTRHEFVDGLARVARLCAWLGPGVLYLVGLQGWRSAVDRSARAGVQSDRLGGVPVYLAPSTSGLNAATPLAAHVEHLRAAIAVGERGGRGE